MHVSGVCSQRIILRFHPPQYLLLFRQTAVQRLLSADQSQNQGQTHVIHAKKVARQNQMEG